MTSPIQIFDSLHQQCRRTAYLLEILENWLSHALTVSVRALLFHNTIKKPEYRCSQSGEWQTESSNSCSHLSKERCPLMFIEVTLLVPKLPVCVEVISMSSVLFPQVGSNFRTHKAAFTGLCDNPAWQPTQ